MKKVINKYFTYEYMGEIASERNIHSYPYYSIQDILVLYRENKDKFINNIKVHPSQYKRKHLS